MLTDRKQRRRGHETDEGPRVYSAKTGPCVGFLDTALYADLLIHLCHFISGAFTKDKKQTSSGQMEAARTAREGNVKTRVTTHLTPEMDAQGVRERCLAWMSQVYGARIIRGEELMEIPAHPDDIPQMG